MCESRGQFGSSDKPRVVPWAQSVISKWTGFSRIAAAVRLPRRLLAFVPEPLDCGQLGDCNGKFDLGSRVVNFGFTID
jgi:hypothetical protein